MAAAAPLSDPVGRRTRPHPGAAVGRFTGERHAVVGSARVNRRIFTEETMGNRNVWLLAFMGIVFGACGEGMEPLAVTPEPEESLTSVFALLDCSVELA